MRDGGEDREEAVEDHARSDREEAVLADLLIGAPYNVFLALRYLSRRLGIPAPCRTLGPFVLLSLQVRQCCGQFQKRSSQGGLP